MGKWERLKQELEDQLAHNHELDCGTLQSILYLMDDIEQEEKENERRK